MKNEINIVIGSWGSYNECNERALGSEWLCLNDYENWDDDIYLYPDFDWYDLGYYFLHEVDCIEIPERLENFIDYKRYGEEFSYDGFHEYDGGIVEIRR